MELLSAFLQTLRLGDNKVSEVTLRNYKADIHQFIEWYESSISKPFSPKDITPGHVVYYIRKKDISKISLARHLSSLRRFFKYLEEQGQLDTKKFPSLIHEKAQDPEDIKAFTIYLYYNKASQLTVKQYRIDVKQFLGYVKKKLGVKNPNTLRKQIAELNTQIVNAYLSYLVDNQGYALTTVTRKKAAINTYIDWLEQEKANAPNR